MKDLFEMTAEERKLQLFKIHPKRLFASVPNNIDDDNDPRLKEIFQKIYDTEFNSYKTRYSGYSEAIYIENQKHFLTEFPLTLHSPNDQIKVTRYLRFLESKKNNSSDDLSLREKALIIVYEGERIGKDKGKLYGHFIFYSKRHNRISPTNSIRTMITKIDLFKRIIPYLSDKAQKVANDDLKTLEANLKENF